MTDRRRINGPAGVSTPPIFALSPRAVKSLTDRVRKPNELRKIFLQTGIVPSAGGSAYLELENNNGSKQTILPTASTIKLSCSVHGPKPLPRTASFSPNLQLTASVKFAPFATRTRQGYIRDSTEKDLGMHLENALKGTIIPDRWPKSAIDIAVTILEAEDNLNHGDRVAGVGLFNVIAGCINVAMAAIADAKIDCLDLLAAGVGAIVSGPDSKPLRVLDPSSAEHQEILASCLVGYLSSRDEIVEIWSTGSVSKQDIDGGIGFEELVDSAVAASRGAQTVLKEVLMESLMRYQVGTKEITVTPDEANDVQMKT
ncbi:uncharacterized protein Z518_03080 [Rhinocladiella mackenziei CBS 650.93]|uniref:Exoribonuclease phosphorolytic domain-containing protein n=1 Tax=Rhinocladiella mackenziei CBS 650.93 TaxID=1442369 RepID=A0A0D2IR22_9EURO|nr:uncharacterized protein Z518_03080 [Rhinocladiella mackenziei CBS 650.93]KIX08424.1 hypothetical protein Z518_03080 [Rhinocladiella mackenziei CBS 650.93]